VTSAETKKGSIPNQSDSAGSEEPSAEDLAEIEAEENGFGTDADLVEELRAEAAANLDRYQRAVADLANYRRRKDQETLRIGAQTRRAVLHDFLPVVDDFERALESTESEVEGEWIEGFRLIERKLWTILESQGVRPMNAVGEPFDPNLHEAVEVEAGAINADTVVGEHRRGFFIGDEVLRPAMVKVGSADSQPEESE
jgi:molecular chaperone GrpE